MTFVTHSGIPATATITINGPTPSTLTGGILTADSTAYPVSVTPAEDNPTQFYLSIPALPLGLHLLHLIIDGATTLYTHIQTRPTPLSPSAGPETLAATITTTTTPATLTVNLNPGPAGPQGPKGDTGDVTPAATAAAAAATASADRAAQQATEATTAATLAGEAADGAQASATAAASSATAAQQAQTAAASAQTSASAAAAAAQSARDVAVQAAAVYDTHVATLATSTTPGHVKLSTDAVQTTQAAPVGLTADGQMVVPMATMTTFGSVKKSSQTGTSLTCIGINNAGQMVLNVRTTHSGFEQVNNSVYIQTSTDDHPTNGNEATACVATDTAGKLAVPPASTTKAGGVLLATGADDARATAVPTAEQFAALVARVAALEAASTNTTA